MTTPNNKIDFAIITALPIERDAVLSKLGNYEEITTPADALHFYLVNLGPAQVLVTCSGPGNVAASRTATTVLERFHPTSVLMVGIAAGFRRKVRLGDVVVAEACYYDGTGKDTATGKLSAPRQIPTGVLLGRSKAYKASDWRESIRTTPPTKPGFQPEVHHGVIVSSEMVVGNPERMAELLKAHRECRALAMEGYGVAEATFHQKVDFLEIRGICDFGDAKKNDKWHTYAAEVAASYAIGLLRYMVEKYPSQNLTGLQDLSGLTPAPNLTGLQDLSGLKLAPNLTGLRDLSGLTPAPNLTGLQDLSGLTAPASSQNLTGLQDLSGLKPLPPESLDLSRLPRPAMPLIGRQAELEQLQQAFLNSKTYLTIVVAAGGIGKSALSDAWIKQIQPHYHGVQRVFAWSFYSQGSHNTQTSSVPFFQVALPFFGWSGEIPKDDVAKGRALAKCLQSQSFILILDGLEPLQHPTHILDGELKDTALQAFLEEVRLYGLAQSPSLILISSRQPLVELQAWEAERFVTIDLQTLPVSDGAKVLAALGVQGTTTELATASEEMGGHALALVLLGKLLKEEFEGEIAQRDQLPPLWVDKKLGGHALRVLQFYEKFWQRSTWQRWWHGGETPERAFLYLLGLFDRPMTLREKEVLVKDAECAKPLRALTQARWKKLERRLEAAGLLLHTEEAERYHWDCHPLIRDYFGQRFQDSQLDWFRQAHRVLFDYYQAVPTQSQPDTLEELEPLYRAVVHGCLAGEYQKALYEVYWERIKRGDEHYSTQKLGAYSQDLTALAAFFPHGWSQPVQHGLAEAEQAWLLAQASFYLMSLGRLGEAVAPREVNLEMRIKQQDWKNASNTARNLIDLYLPLGQLAQAATVARQAIQYAEQSGDLFQQMGSHAYLATTLHRQGPLDLAQQSFQRAEQLMQERYPEYPQLSSLPGFQYCALLLDQAQSVAEFEAVLRRGEYGLERSKRNNWLLDMALDHLTLARVLTQLQRDDEAAAAFDQAVAGIRKASFTLFLPFFLIDRANFHLRPRDNTPSRGVIPDAALHDLQEADSLIRRCGMKLYAVDCQLAWCRYYLARGEKEKARECWGRAKMGMEVTGYGLRAGEVRALGEKLLSKSEDLDSSIGPNLKIWTPALVQI